MESMMTCVTASMANGSKDTTTRTEMFDATMRGEASHTILKIGSVLRSAASRSFQRGTGLACSEPNVPQTSTKKLYRRLHLYPASRHNFALFALLRRLPKGEKKVECATRGLGWY